MPFRQEMNVDLTWASVTQELRLVKKLQRKS